MAALGIDILSHCRTGFRWPVLNVRCLEASEGQLLALSDFDLSVRSSVTTKRKDSLRRLTFPNGKLHLIDATERIGGAS